jgi:hypothetical protein
MLAMSDSDPAPSPAPTARDALGMPVPPAALVRAATRARNGLDRAHRGAAPPFQLVLERALGIVDTKTLACAVELDIPDRLADGPRTVAELATACGAEPDALRRVLRYLVSRGLFRERPGDRFANNPATDILRVDHPWSWRPWVTFTGASWHTEIWDHLSDRVRTGRPATELAHGESFFDYVNRTNPDAGDAFNGAMESASRVQGLLFAEHVDVSAVRRVCDVGGGSGAVLVNLLRTHPHLRGTVFDLPELAPEARTLFGDAGVADRADFAGGDFFAEVPAGCDLYTLFAIVHDWDDDRCRQILVNVGAAMTPGARVMVVERPLPTDGRPDFAKLADMLMLVLGAGGRERSDAEDEDLFRSAGIAIRARHTLPSLFVAYELGAA